jgi:hypothetical protein
MDTISKATQFTAMLEKWESNPVPAMNNFEWNKFQAMQGV